MILNLVPFPFNDVLTNTKNIQDFSIEFTQGLHFIVFDRNYLNMHMLFAIQDLPINVPETFSNHVKFPSSYLKIWLYGIKFTCACPHGEARQNIYQLTEIKNTENADLKSVVCGLVRFISL